MLHGIFLLSTEPTGFSGYWVLYSSRDLLFVSIGSHKAVRNSRALSVALSECTYTAFLQPFWTSQSKFWVSEVCEYSTVVLDSDDFGVKKETFWFQKCTNTALLESIWTILQSEAYLKRAFSRQFNIVKLFKYSNC